MSNTRRDAEKFGVVENTMTDLPSGRNASAPALRFWRQKIAEHLKGMECAAQERTRIEQELAQMLYDEAEASGIDCNDADQTTDFVHAERERLGELAEELSRGQKQQVTDFAPPESLDVDPSRGGVALHLESSLSDLKVAVRSLLKRPGFTAVILVTLILGIGLNSAVFSVLNGVLFKPLPVEEPDRLLRIYATEPEGFMPQEPMAIPDLEDIRRLDSIENVAGQAMSLSALSIDNRSEIVNAEIVTDNLFELLGLVPRLGRLFSSTELSGTEGDVAILSTAAWESKFDADPTVIGRTVRFNGHPVEIIGVMPSDFKGVVRALEPQIWLPLESALRMGGSPSMNSGPVTEDSLFQDRSRRSLWGFARLAPGFSVEQARGELDSLAVALAAEYPNTNEDRSFLAVPFANVKLLPVFDTHVDTASYIILGLVFLVLLIASANLANLLLVRAHSRRGEIATRLSLGATRARIVRQLLIESLLLAVLGGVGGLAVAYAASWAVSRTRIDLAIPVQVSVGLDMRVVLFTAAVAALTSVLFGLLPAIQASKTNLATVIQETSRRGVGRLRAQNLMVVAQVAFSLVLLIFAGLALRSMLNATRIDIGIETDGVAGFSVFPETQGYEREDALALLRSIKERLESLPGAAAVSEASHLPLTLSMNTQNVVPAYRAGEDPDTWPDVDMGWYDEQYFDAMGVKVLEGRVFTETEVEDQARVVVINQHMAETLFPDRNAVGEELVNGPEAEPFRVVGVVSNGKYRTLGEAQRPYMFQTLNPDVPMHTVVVRFDDPDRAALETILGAVRELDPDLALSAVGKGDQLISSSTLVPRAVASVFGVLGIIGLVLSAVGLFGTLAYTVSRATHEIGLRVAIGASSADVIKMVVGRGLAMVGSGVLIGTLVAFFSTKFLSSMLYGISPTDVLTFVGVIGVLLLVALLATLMPARRALRISPTEALRYD